MQEEHSFTAKKGQVVNTRCAICNQIMTKEDLVTIGINKNQEVVMHFKCYIEIQEKICAECGRPFHDQEEVWFCEEHRQYLHIENKCILKHMSKHLSFKKGIYDSTRNRVAFLEKEDIQSLL